MKLQKIIFLLVFSFILDINANAQQVYPGDVNNNGVVNHIDMLYVGLANQQIGVPRAIPGILWQPYDVTNWGVTFPNGLDYAYADCDGNGFIDEFDFFAIEQNYGLEHGTVTEDVFQAGTPGVDAQLIFDTLGFINPHFPTQVVFASISLGTQSLPTSNFYGISFSIKYDPDVFCLDNGCTVDFLTSGPWVDPSGFFSFTGYNFKDNDPQSGEMQITIVKTDQQVVTGFGGLGAFVGIIEEDLIDFYAQNQTSTLLELTDIKYVDANFNEYPIVNDSLNVQIIEPDSLSTSIDDLEKIDVEIYPNPVIDNLYIKSSDHNPILDFQLLDAQGRSFRQVNTNLNSSFLEYSTSNIPTGIYFAKLLTEQGVVMKKIMIQRE